MRLFSNLANYLFMRLRAANPRAKAPRAIANADGSGIIERFIVSTPSNAACTREASVVKNSNFDQSASAFSNKLDNRNDVSSNI